MFMHFGVLKKFTRPYSRQKIRFGKKAVIFAFDLAGAGWSSGAGNGVNEIGRLPKSVTQGGFTCARWRGDDKQNSVAREFVTQGFAPAPESSPARSCTLPPAARFRHHSLSRPEC